MTSSEALDCLWRSPCLQCCPSLEQPDLPRPTRPCSFCMQLPRGHIAAAPSQPAWTRCSLNWQPFGCRLPCQLPRQLLLVLYASLGLYISCHCIARSALPLTFAPRHFARRLACQEVYSCAALCPIFAFRQPGPLHQLPFHCQVSSAFDLCDGHLPQHLRYNIL